MRLTLQTDYSLRVLIQVALNEEGLTRISDVAKSFGISKNHLMKLAHELGKKGYLETVRGRNGGLRLMRKPGDINVGQVVRDTEDDLDVVGCMHEPGYCTIARACILKSALRSATGAFLSVLDGYTLEDLIKPRKAISVLLFPQRAAARAG